MYAIVGITTMDLFNSGIAKMPEFGGDEFTVNNLAFCDNPLSLVLGGNAAIACYVLAKLGARAANCSAVGQDRLGGIVADWLDDAGVDVRGLLRAENAATPTTTVMTDAALNRVSFHHPGASTIYTPRHLPDAIWNDAKVLLLSSFSLLPQWRPAGFADAAARARKADIVTALDIGPAIGQPVVLSELTDVLPNIDYFICNEHELAVCTAEDDLVQGMAHILDAGVGGIVIKQGAAGVSLRMAGAETVSHVTGFAVQARFTVGAGDSFNAGFLYALRQGKDVVEAARFANAVAALVVSAAQGALGAPGLTQVEELLSQHII